MEVRGLREVRDKPLLNLFETWRFTVLNLDRGLYAPSIASDCCHMARMPALVMSSTAEGMGTVVGSAESRGPSITFSLHPSLHASLLFGCLPRPMPGIFGCLVSGAPFFHFFLPLVEPTRGFGPCAHDSMHCGDTALSRRRHGPGMASLCQASRR